jgi:hypothetical protein
MCRDVSRHLSKTRLRLLKSTEIGARIFPSKLNVLDSRVSAVVAMSLNKSQEEVKTKKKPFPSPID